MDNRIFNVNGAGKEDLLAALTLAFNQRSNRNPRADGYAIDPDSGLVLLWYNDPGRLAGKGEVQEFKFPSPLSAAEVMPMVWAWLQDDKTWVRPKEKWDQWDYPLNHDGSNSQGWRVFCGDWGHVGKYTPGQNQQSYSNAICGVLPAYMWHGK